MPLVKDPFVLLAQSGEADTLMRVRDDPFKAMNRHRCLPNPPRLSKETNRETTHP
jgi:hypothetical protein